MCDTQIEDEIVAKRGRKPLRPADRNSEWLTVRVKPAVREALEHLARESGHSISREMQQAFDRWIAWRQLETAKGRRAAFDLKSVHGRAQALIAATDDDVKLAMFEIIQRNLTDFPILNPTPARRWATQHMILKRRQKGAKS